MSEIVSCDKRYLTLVGDNWLINIGKNVKRIRKYFENLYNNKIEENLLKREFYFCDNNANDKDLYIKYLYLSPYEIKLNKKQVNVNDMTAQTIDCDSNYTTDNNNEAFIIHKRIQSPLLRLSSTCSDIDNNMFSFYKRQTGLKHKIYNKMLLFQDLSLFEEFYVKAYEKTIEMLNEHNFQIRVTCLV